MARTKSSHHIVPLYTSCLQVYSEEVLLFLLECNYKWGSGVNAIEPNGLPAGLVPKALGIVISEIVFIKSLCCGYLESIRGM